MAPVDPSNRARPRINSGGVQTLQQLTWSPGATAGLEAATERHQGLQTPGPHPVSPLSFMPAPPAGSMRLGLSHWAFCKTGGHACGLPGEMTQWKKDGGRNQMPREGAG